MMDMVHMEPSMEVVALMDKCGNLGLAMVMYLSTAMAAIVNTAATIDMCVMKFVTRQNMAPKDQSLG